ncbi:MAG: hypothetical protein J2P13_00865 [Acidobacteria bacterium]|nr:hypothetical protein [Acidobacteriota bacterium]
MLVAVVLSLTVAGSVALGIGAAYASVIVLLQALASSRRQASQVVLVASENQAGGD